MNIARPCLLLALAPLALFGCSADAGSTLDAPSGDADPDALTAAEDSGADPTQDGVDYLDDEAEAEVPLALDPVFSPNPELDLAPGLTAATAWLYEAVREELGDEEAAALPDLFELLAGDEERDAAVAGPQCEAAAVVAGIYHVAPNLYRGLWWAPNAELVGGMGGRHRALATPGGQWAGGFGTESLRLGPQGGLWDRDFDGTGQFAGWWSAPRSPYEGGIGGHWISLSARGGFFFGLMSVCGW